MSALCPNLRSLRSSRLFLMAALPMLAGCGGGGGELSEYETKKLITEVESFPQALTLEIDGQQVTTPLEALEIDLGEKESDADTYELHGPTVFLVGTLAGDARVTHEQKWELLLNKPIAVLPRATVHRREQTGRLLLPGYPTWPVVGGSFTVEKIGRGFNRKTPLSGKVEIRCETPEGEKTFRGTFSVKGTTFG